MTLSRLSLVLVLLSIPWSQAQTPALAQQRCDDQRTCRDCIRAPNCVWCEDTGFIGARCRRTNVPGCVNVTSPSGEITSTEPAPEDVAINPVKVDLSLRPGRIDTQTFPVIVTALRNLPLDLYILMDLSGSMTQDLESVKLASLNILDSLSNITTNARLGFGSFDDKPVRPFTGEFGTVASLCVGPDSEETCPYAFVHRISMTSNDTFFESQINQAATTISTDNPENGLEALAQVITCEEIMGWRDRSADGPERGLNRIVLFITDDAFHFAGEGRLAGIPWPYNGRCLLDPPTNLTDRVFYERWDEYDFPSVGEIAALLTQYRVIPIFAIPPSDNSGQSILTTYEDLAALISESTRAVAANLAEQSSNIVDILRQEIERLIRTIALTPQAPGGLDADFEITATCPDGATVINDGRACDDVILEQVVEFEVAVTLKSCYDKVTGAPLDFPIEVEVNVIGYGDFTISISGICTCACEANVRVNASECNGNGDFSCGACQCREPWCGPTCNLMRTDIPDCPDGIGGEECSGELRGECDCVCQCQNPPDPSLLSQVQATLTEHNIEPVIFGEACECDNFNCDIINGTICSDRGDCCNQVCVCDFKGNSREELDQYLGDNCECGTARDVCVDPNNQTGACNGVGECGCNRCECNAGFTGQYCEMIDPGFVSCNPTAGTCVLCQKGKSSNCGACDGRNFDVALVAASQVEDAMEIEALADVVFSPDGPFIYSEPQCSVIDSDDCEHEYFLVYNDNRYAILAIDDESCPSSSGFELGIEVWALAIIILVILLVLGILILVLIKVIFIILDYIEVKKLEKEARGADFSKNQNPLYQSPEMKYENVLYGRPV